MVRHFTCADSLGLLAAFMQVTCSRVFLHVDVDCGNCSLLACCAVLLWLPLRLVQAACRSQGLSRGVAHCAACCGSYIYATAALVLPLTWPGLGHVSRLRQRRVLALTSAADTDPPAVKSMVQEPPAMNLVARKLAGAADSCVRVRGVWERALASTDSWVVCSR